MIWDALFDFARSIAEKLGRQLAALVPPVPEWIGQGAGMVRQLLGMATSLGNWVPVGLFAVVVASVVACLIAGLGIKVARIVASFVTLGGGGAG